MSFHRRQVTAARVCSINPLPLELNRPVANGMAAADRHLLAACKIVEGSLACGQWNAKADTLPISRDHQAPGSRYLRNQVRIARAYHQGNPAFEEVLQLSGNCNRTRGAHHALFLHQIGPDSADFS